MRNQIDAKMRAAKIHAEGQFKTNDNKIEHNKKKIVKAHKKGREIMYYWKLTL